MRALYQHFTPHRFHRWVLYSSVASDFIILLYLYLRASDEAYFAKMLDQLDGQGHHFPAEFREALFAQWLSMLTVGILLAALFHAFIYFLWHKQKSYARKYLALYAWVSGPLCLLGGLGLLFTLSPWGLAFIPLGLNFLFVAMGLKRFAFPQ